MIDCLKPYPSYKNSGVDWLGSVPESWSVGRQASAVELRVSNVDKHVVGGETPVRLCNYVDVYKNDRIHLGMDFSRGTARPSEVERFRLEPGDVVITKDSESWDDIASPALVEEGSSDLVCGYHLAILRPGPDLSGPYLFRATQSVAVAAQYHVAANGVTRFGLTQGGIRGIHIPFPPSEDQAAIVRYLEYIDSRIQRFIAAKERLIKLLEEEKQAIIHRAVTRGLDPDVPLKSSGVDWLGNVPESWEVRRLSTTTAPPLGGVWGDEPSGTESDLPCVRVADFDRDRSLVRGGPLTIRSISSSERSRRILASGDLLLEKSGGGDKQAVGAVVRFDRDEPAVFSNFIARLQVRKDGDDPSFLTYLHRTMYGRGINVRSIKQTTGIQNLSVSSYLAESAAFPPRSEQGEIASHLDRSLAEVRRTQAAAGRHISLLRQYRTRLISDVVTGKLDVREAVGDLPGPPDDGSPSLDEKIEEAAA